MIYLDGDKLVVNLPQGRTQTELISDLAIELEALGNATHGLHIVIEGRITTGMCLYLGHKLAHVCKSVSIYDPKEGSNVLCVSH